MVATFAGVHSATGVTSQADADGDLTVACTVPGGANLAIICWGIGDSSGDAGMAITAMTFNGVACTNSGVIIHENNAVNGFLQVYYILNPTSGNLVVTSPANGRDILCNVVYYSGAGAPVGFVTAAGSSSPYTISIAAATTSIAAALFGAGSPNFQSVGTPNRTKRFGVDLNSFSAGGNIGYQEMVGTGASAALSWTAPSPDWWGAIAFEVPASGGGTTPVGKDLTVAYDVRAAVNKTLASLWDIHATVSDDLVSAWDVRAAVNAQKALAWDIRSVIGQTLNAAWDVRALATDNLTVLWDTRAAVSRDAVVLWDVRSAVGQVLSLLWDVRAVLGDPITLVWDVRSPAGQDLTISWDVLSGIITTPVGKDLILSYDVLAAVNDTLTVAYDVRAVVRDDLVTLWDTRAVVSASSPLTWDVRSVAGDTQPLLWGVRATTRDDLTVTYDVRQLAGDDLVLLWSTQSLVVIPQHLLETSILDRWRSGVLDRWKTEVLERWRTEVTDE